MAFFQKLELVLKNPKSRVNLGILERKAIALDEDLIKNLRDFLNGSSEAILLGPQDSGKTITAKALGFRMLTEDRFNCLYGNARDLDDLSKTVDEIEAYEKYKFKTLFIIEDCHTNEKVERLLNRIIDQPRKKTILLLTTRHLESRDDIFRTFAKVYFLKPKKLAESIIKKHIEMLRQQPKYAESQFLPRKNEDLDKLVNELLNKLKTSNLRLIDRYLDAWNPLNKSLTDINEKNVLYHFLEIIKPSTSLSSLEAQECLLPLCAIDQFEIDVHMTFLKSNSLEQLINKGLVECNRIKDLCRLPDSSDAIWYLKAAEENRSLQVEGRLVNISEYVKYYIIKYSISTPRPQKLLQSLRNKDNKLAKEVIHNQDFRHHILIFCKEPFFRAELPYLFRELRILNGIDLYLNIFDSFKDHELDDIGKKGVLTLGEFLNEFSSWSMKGGDSAQRRYLYKSSNWGLLGYKLAQRWMSKQSTQPEILANEIIVGIKAGHYSIADLVDLVYNLNWLKSDIVCRLIDNLDLSKINEKFLITRIRVYADLLDVIKHSRCGVNNVEKLTPPLELVASRIREGTGRDLRDMMNALFMHDREQLWDELTDNNLQKIVDRSTLNQFCNLLTDAVESKNNKSKLLGKKIATRLVKLDLSPLIKSSNLTDASTFNLLLINLNPELDEKFLDHIMPYLEGIIQREPNKKQIINKITLILRDFRKLTDNTSVSPVAYNFLEKLTKLNLLPYFHSSNNGIVEFIYWALRIDEDLTRKWLKSIEPIFWKNMLLEVPDKIAFWIIWDIWQVEPSIACSLANEPMIKNKIGVTSQGLGLLMLCGIKIEKTTITISISRLKNDLANLNPIEIGLSLKVLCDPRFHVEANHIRKNMDIENLSNTILNAYTSEHNKTLLKNIINEFKEIT